MLTIEKTDYQDLREFTILNNFDALAKNAQITAKQLVGDEPFDSTDFAIVRNGEVWAITLILYKEHGYITVSSNAIAFDETEIFGEVELIKTFSFLR